MHPFALGFLAFFKGIQFSMLHFKKWFLVPVFLWLIITVGLSFQLGNFLVPILNEWFGVTKQHADLTLIEVIKSGLKWGLVLFLQLLFWYVSSRFMKYLVLLLLSPMFAYLSQKTDEILTSKKYPFNLLQFLSDIKRGIIITLRNAFLESIIIFLGIILSVFFPLFSPIVLMLLFLLNSYLMAFNFFDYIAERKGLGVNKSIRYMHSNFSTLLGFGVAYNLVSFVPFLDWVLAPISAASGAVIADFEKSGLINSKNNV